MALATLLALALQAAVPQAPAPAPAAAPPAAAAPARTPAELAFAEPLPPGAPSDDYEFVGWCHGALTGHLDLYNLVKDDLNALPDPDPRATAAGDAEMIEAGRQYLALYARAMEAAEKASPQSISARGLAARTSGQTIWNAAKVAEPKTRMWSWTFWVLPGRCEYAAERLYEKSMLTGQALGVNMRTAPVTAPPKPPERDALGAIIPR
jgi:hypothetical protein